jgi:hypothetical protein
MMRKRHIRVVNMIPKSLSAETNQDSEPQVTVNPENPRMIIGTTFTPDPGGGPQGPVFASVDGGESWVLDLVVPGGEPNDQSVRFGGGSALYAGTLRGNIFLQLNILRSAPYSPTVVMQELVARNSDDQPYVSALAAKGKDHVFVGNNDSAGGAVDLSEDARTGAPPAGFAKNLIDPRTPFIRDSPSIRAAPHRDGTVYVAYFHWTLAGPVQADVVVARDDHFGAGPPPFDALVDSGDGFAGVRVVQSVAIPWFFVMGLERVGSALSIAVHPRHSHIVYLAWGDTAPGSTQTLHVRRSLDRGATWSPDLFSVVNATNPALAITEDGKVGFLYQQVVLASGGTQRWETHCLTTRDGWATPAQDILLATTPVDGATFTFNPYIGDYDDLQAHRDQFFGIFSAHNLPDRANFPHGVRYQRNANFATKQLLTLGGAPTVANSIDPFFFHIFWKDEEREEIEEHGGAEYERLRIRGLKYERLEIEDIEFVAASRADAGDDGWEDDRRSFGPDRHPRHHHRVRREARLGAARVIRRIADRLEDLSEHIEEEGEHRRHGEDE